MDRSYEKENRVELARLKALVAKWSDDELKRPLGDGWTVAAVLAHLAFWDQRALILIAKYKRGAVTPSPADTDVINDTVRVLGLAIPPRAAATLAVESAEAIDRELEQLTDTLLAEIAQINAVRLDRAKHRREHLDQIERALKAA